MSVHVSNNDEVKNLYKKTTFFDVLIGLALAFVSIIFFRKYTFPLLTGLIIANLSFLVNSISTNKLLSSSQGIPKLLLTLMFFSRIIFVCAIGILFFTYNKEYLIAYIVGYSAHLMAIVLYGITLNNKERM